MRIFLGGKKVCFLKSAMSYYVLNQFVINSNNQILLTTDLALSPWGFSNQFHFEKWVIYFQAVCVRVWLPGNQPSLVVLVVSFSSQEHLQSSVGNQNLLSSELESESHENRFFHQIFVRNKIQAQLFLTAEKNAWNCGVLRCKSTGM